MRSQHRQLLTYLAQVRQVPYRNVWLLTPHASITRHSLLTPHRGKYGALHRGIVTIGTVRVVDWDALNKNTGVWLRVVETWQKITVSTF